MDELERRLRRVEDRWEIADLIADYALKVDDRDWAAIEDMYAEDSVFDSAAGRHEGRAAVTKYYAERTELFGVTYHIPHTHTVTFVSDDEATGVVAGHAELSYGGSGFIIAMRYHDLYVRERGRWRFKERDVRQLYAVPMADLPEAMTQELRKRWPGTEPAPADLGIYR